MAAGSPFLFADQRPGGWAVLLAYLVAAWLGGRNARAAAGLAEVGAPRTAEMRARQRLWFGLALLLLLLGTTRLSDLQALPADLVRRQLHVHGVYDQRGGLQIGLIAAIGLFGAFGLSRALVRVRRTGLWTLVAVAGAGLLLLSTGVRAVSLHAIDRALGRPAGLPFLTVNALVELGLLSLVAAASLLAGRALDRERRLARLHTLRMEEQRRILGEKRRAARS